MIPAPATATAPVTEVEPAAKLPTLPKLHIEKITKLEDIAKVIAKLNAQKPAGMLNMPKDLKASVELLRTLLSGDPRNMTAEDFEKLLTEKKLVPSNMKDLIVSKSRTIDLSLPNMGFTLFPTDIGGDPTVLSKHLTALLKESLKCINPPLVVVRAPNAEAGDPLLQSLGTWCKMHQEDGFKDTTQDAFNLLRATTDDFNPLTARDTNLLSVGQLIRLAGVSVEEIPATEETSPNSDTPASINIIASAPTKDNDLFGLVNTALNELARLQFFQPKPDQLN
jgi:hypothetical protein